MSPNPKILVIGSPNGVVPDDVWADFCSRYQVHMYEFPTVDDFHNSLKFGDCQDISCIMRMGINVPANIEKVGRGWTRRALPYFPPSLKLIVNFGHGHDEEDLPGLAARGIEFSNTTGGSEATAAVAIYLVIAVFRQLGRYERMLRDDQFLPARRHSAQNAIDPHGKKLGIVGMGSIGQTVARQAAALGMEIHCIDRPNLRKLVETTSGDSQYIRTLLPPITLHENLESLVSRVDCLVLACSYSTATHHLLSRDVFATMKQRMRIVNVARGKCIDEDAMCDAIESGTLSGVGLDVYYNEPKVNARLLQYDCVTLLPHLGGLTSDSMRNHALMAMARVDEFFY
ncbi:Glyoxylate/hydroxypyruvate reductase HPR3 [Colletotrichum orbiculare MAFF 240422]|uniref:Glyoxylate/hydroxypyruvate reductase HPR3 n=1 Tax=Colletotrichum orbiculare (strain 104-T / ATCC 96160 / CBS 514.97 / LARS 414 / MAFF 240422) TaxID=1213857 RepID=N4V7X4_COLOR|nr:Glyoxylate/hydroxypyruvate reductase HPR3 [Colletotrichum orbiculare MAFF 240422]